MRLVLPIVLMLAMPWVMAADTGPVKSTNADPTGKVCGASEYGVLYHPSGALFCCDSGSGNWKLCTQLGGQSMLLESAAPCLYMLDSDTDDATSMSLCSTATSTAAGHEYVDVILQSVVNGSLTTWYTMDASASEAIFSTNVTLNSDLKVQNDVDIVTGSLWIEDGPGYSNVSDDSYGWAASADSPNSARFELLVDDGVTGIADLRYDPDGTAAIEKTVGGGAGDQFVFDEDGSYRVESNDPCYALTDLDNDDTVSAKICAQSTDTTADHEDVNVVLSSMIDGTMSEWFQGGANAETIYLKQKVSINQSNPTLVWKDTDTAIDGYQIDSDCTGSGQCVTQFGTDGSTWAKHDENAEQFQFLLVDPMRYETRTGVPALFVVEAPYSTGTPVRFGFSFEDRTQSGTYRAFFGIDDNTGLLPSRQQIVLSGYHAGTEYPVFSVARRIGNFKIIGGRSLDVDDNANIGVLADQTTTTLGFTTVAGTRSIYYNDSIASWEMDTDNHPVDDAGGGDCAPDVTFGEGSIGLACDNGVLTIDVDQNGLPESQFDRYRFVGFAQPGGRGSASDKITMEQHATLALCYLQEFYNPVTVQFDQVRIEVTDAFPSVNCDFEIYHLADGLGNMSPILQDSATQDVDWSSTGIKTYTLSSTVYLEQGVHYVYAGCDDDASDETQGSLGTVIDSGGNELPTMSAHRVGDSATAGCAGANVALNPTSPVRWDSFLLEDAIWFDLKFTGQEEKNARCNDDSSAVCVTDADCGTYCNAKDCWNNGTTCP